jgi:hypothetical protein
VHFSHIDLGAIGHLPVTATDQPRGSWLSRLFKRR